MDYCSPVNTPIFEGDGDPKKHWLVSESPLQANLIDDENQKIAYFVEVLRNIMLTWYMNFLEEGPKSKQQIKENFLKILKVDDTKNLVKHNLKEIKQRIGESIREYG